MVIDDFSNVIVVFSLGTTLQRGLVQFLAVKLHIWIKRFQMKEMHALEDFFLMGVQK